MSVHLFDLLRYLRMGLNHKEASSPICFISNIKVKLSINVMLMLPHEH